MSAIAARRARLAAIPSSSEATPEPRIEGGSVLNGKHTTEENGSEAKSTEDYEPKQKRRLAAKEGDKKRHKLRTGESNGSSDNDITSNEASAHLFVPRTTGRRRNVELCRDVEDASLAGAASVVCALKAGETMILKGCGTITVLQGLVEINGAHLGPQHKASQVFAPSTSALPTLQVPLGASIIEEPDARFPTGFEIKSFAAFIRISELPSTELPRISGVCPLVSHEAFTPKPMTDWPLKNFAPLFDSANIMQATLSPAWKDALDRLEQHFSSTSAPICIVRGPKRVGKSTFSRFGLQRLLTSMRITSRAIAYLETDLGQSEFGLAETIALHVFDSAVVQCTTSSPLLFAPSWASYRQAAATRFLGELSPKNEPDEYMTSIADLVHVYRSQWQADAVPLVVNTQGWVKGLGADLLRQLEELLNPTLIIDVVEYSSGTTAVAWSNGCEIVTIPAPTALARERGLNATEARQMNLTSYHYMTSTPCSNALLQHLDRSNAGDGSLPRWNFDLPLVAQRPYIVDITSGIRAGIHICVNSTDIDYRMQLLSLNGAAVALVMIAQLSNKDAKTASSEKGYEQAWMSALQKPLPPRSRVTYVGHAIVRSIDVEKGQIHLLSPIDSLTFDIAQTLTTRPTESAHADNTTSSLALIKGSPTELPVWLSLDGPALLACQKGMASGKEEVTTLAGTTLRSVPYLDFTEGRDDTLIGMKKRTFRRNLLRPSQRRPADD